jgi:hypothetical protein
MEVSFTLVSQIGTLSSETVLLGSTASRSTGFDTCYSPHHGSGLPTPENMRESLWAVISDEADISKVALEDIGRLL